MENSTYYVNQLSTGGPRLFRGGSSSLTFTGVHSRNSRDDLDTAEVCGIGSGYGTSRARARFTLRVYGKHKQNSVGQHFWARDYMVSTVGRDEAVICEYIRNQEQEDSAIGPTQPVEVTCHRQGGPTSTGASLATLPKPL
jgi:hypothetical protein